MRQLLFFYLLILSAFTGSAAYAQVNIMGKPGYMSTPSAAWDEERVLGISFAYVPKEYSLFSSASNRNTINFYNVRAGLTSFMEVNFSVAYRPLMADQIGIGDRQLDFRFRLLSETANRPSLVLGWTPPGSVSPMMAHDYLVATKNITTSIGVFRISAGYGSPYLILRNQEKEGFFNALEIKKKIDFRRIDYLTGFFGGVSYMPRDYWGVMAEYNTSTFNTGVFIKPLKWLTLQVYSYEAKEWAFSFATHFPLNFKPRTLRRYEKNLD